MVSASEVRSVINQATALRKRGVTPLQVSTTDYSNKDFKRLPITSAISRLELDLFNSEGDKVVTEADNRALGTENNGLRSENSSLLAANAAILKENKDLKARLEAALPSSTTTDPPKADRGSPDGVEEGKTKDGDSDEEEDEEDGLGLLVAGNPDPTNVATPQISPSKAKKAAKKAGQRQRKETSKRKEGDPPVCSAVLAKSFRTNWERLQNNISAKTMIRSSHLPEDVVAETEAVGAAAAAAALTLLQI
jgi:hypothetical protein